MAALEGLAVACRQLASLGSQQWAAARLFSSSSVVQRILRPAELPQRPDSAALDDPKTELVDRFLSEELMSAAQRRQAALTEQLHTYQRREGDTGSSEVQVALLTQKISTLADHMRVHRKDFSSRRGLEAMLTQRRRLLQYLRRTDFDTYAALLVRLGMRDTFSRPDRLTLRVASSQRQQAKHAA